MNASIGHTRQPPETSHEQLASSALKDFRIIFNSVKKHFKQVEKQCGISSSQLWVLWELHKTPGLKVSELAGKLAIHQSTTSNLIEKTARKALISKKREDQDQRVVRLYLTEAGRDIVKKAPDSPRGVLTEAIDRLSIADLMQLQSSLEKLIGNMKLKDEADAMKPLSSH